MRKVTRLLICILVIVTWLFTAQQAYAHLIGQPPYFKVDGVYSGLYPVPVTSLPDFILPQDIAPKNYLVNQSINFAFDIKAMPAPADVVKKTKFSWDFGDGTKGFGLEQNHIYKKLGSYLVIIYADDGSTPAPQVIQSLLINILPDPSYKLPQAVIKVNGKTSKDPLTEVLKFDFSNQLTFDGSSSKTADSKISSVLWDFGDQKSSDQIKTSHSYSADLTQLFPVLRIKDGNGFISDAFVEVQNKKLTDLNPIPSSSETVVTPKSSTLVNITPILLVICVVLVVIFMARWWLRGRGRGRN